MAKKILKLIPNTGKDLKQLRDASDLVGTLITALFASLIQEPSSAVIINRMLENVRWMHNQAVRGKAAKREIETTKKALDLMQNLIVANSK
jgi:hypothetical protein